MAPCQPSQAGHVLMRIDTGCYAKRAVRLRKGVARLARAPVKARAAVMSEMVITMTGAIALASAAFAALAPLCFWESDS